MEKPTDILRFIAEYRKGREVATVNRALSTLGAAINWGRFQDPPCLSTTPFHRFGVTIKVKDETKRDRRRLHWHDLRHEGVCRLLAQQVDIRTIQLMLGHADIKQTQRYLNITDEELRKAMTGVSERRRQLKAVSQ